MDIHELQPHERPDWLTMREMLWPDFKRDEMTPVEAAMLSDRSRTGIYVAAAEAGKLIGFVEVSLRDWAEGCSTHPVGYIEGWYVDAEHRGGGIGRRLIETAEAWAAERRCTEMASDADVHNDVSHRAHAALGYREIGRAVLFCKKLDGC
jgi:aminoglycoside 6'-N-acetyltransferase I